MAPRSRQNQRFPPGSLSGMEQSLAFAGCAPVPSRRRVIVDLRLAPAMHGSLNASGTKPRSTSTTSPSGVASGVITCQPGVAIRDRIEVALLAVVEAALDADAQIADILADLARVSASVRVTGSACARASIWAISPCFHSSRCSCQTPSPIRSASDAAKNAVRKETARPHACSLRGEPTLFRLVLVLQRDQHALERSQEQQGQEDGERPPDERMQPIRRCVGHLHDKARRRPR